MHLTQHLKNRGEETLISIEIVPPEKGKSIDQIFRAVEDLLRFDPTFVSVTSHAHERVIQKTDGKRVLRVRRKRLDTNAICLELGARYGIEPIPHIICAGFTKDETEDALYTLNFHEIDNVLALRGDPPNNQKYKPRSHGHRYAAELVQQIVNLNNGIYLDPIENPIRTNFCTGVAGYPEKHPEAPDLRSDLRHLKEKVDGGAGYVITQMFFDNSIYYRFLEKARKIGITVPIIPGIKPICSLQQLTSVPKAFGITVPEKFREEMLRYETKEEVRSVGLEHTTRQCENLIRNKVPCIHFYTMSKADPTREILKRVLGVRSRRRFRFWGPNQKK
jgi:methylenetetrahydrofolate reductase (NADPH)